MPGEPEPFGHTLCRLQRTSQTFLTSSIARPLQVRALASGSESHALLDRRSQAQGPH